MELQGDEVLRTAYEASFKCYRSAAITSCGNIYARGNFPCSHFWTECLQGLLQWPFCRYICPNCFWRSIKAQKRQFLNLWAQNEPQCWRADFGLLCTPKKSKATQRRQLSRFTGILTKPEPHPRHLMIMILQAQSCVQKNAGNEPNHAGDTPALVLNPSYTHMKYNLKTYNLSSA